jgi:hypothetical protein
LQFLYLGEQGTDDGLRFRRLAGDQFFRDLQRHALQVGEKPACGQTDSQKTSPRVVADYLRAYQHQGLSITASHRFQAAS